MQNHRQSDRLSWGDTVFLHLEREGMPLNVASICMLEGEVSFEDCLQFVESKLPLLPRYLKRVVAPPLNIGLPSWEYDPNFDVRNHVREVRLKHGTDTELKALAGRLFSEVMDRRRPLWDITLVRGLNGNRTALILRLHHCLADGIAGVGILNAMLDASPEAPPLPKKKIRFQVPPPPDAINSLMDGVVSSYSDFVKRILSAWADLLDMTERMAANGGNLATEEFSRFFPEITAFTERLRFNVPYRGPQKFAYTEIPLADVKAIRHKCGTSVNDVILALVTATVRRYCELHGDRVKGRLLRIMVPVNLRGKDCSPGELGNRISLVPVTIPLDIRPLRRLLAAIHRRTEFLKHSHAAELVSLAGGLIGMFPTSVQALAGPVASRLPITPFNLVCTNVPGPQFPLYLRGHKMLQCYPYVPIGGEMAVNCAILSYDGTIYFGFSGDVHAAPDLRRLEKLLRSSFTELRDAVGIKPPRKKRARPARAQTVLKPAPVETVRVSIPLPANIPAVEAKRAPAPAIKQEEVQTQFIVA
jgi:diacylglycerol O-acyltransferase